MTAKLAARTAPAFGHRWRSASLAELAAQADRLSAQMVTSSVVTQMPQAPPTITNNLLTISVFLRQPAMVRKMITDLAYQRFIADFIFAAGPNADAGAVIYDQITGLYLFLDRDVQSIAPGAEFPILNGSRPNPLVALTQKWGGEVMVTDEAERRDSWDLLRREMTRLTNTIIRKVDSVAVAALNAAPIRTMASGTGWGNPVTADIITDLAQAIQAVNGPDFGYVVDTVLLNPTQVASLLQSQEIRNALPRERTDVPIATGSIGRLMGLDFVQSNRVSAGTVYVLQRKQIGSISDEVPLSAKVIRDDRAETSYIHAGRLMVPYVTDPLACIKITGC